MSARQKTVGAWLLAAGASIPAAAAEPRAIPGHDRSFWRGIVQLFLRAFSALDLSILAALDNQHPFLDDAELAGLLSAALAYLAGEKDLRAFDTRHGWMHATAHTADLLKFLGRNPRLRPADQGRI